MNESWSQKQPKRFNFLNKSVRHIFNWNFRSMAWVTVFSLVGIGHLGVVSVVSAADEAVLFATVNEYAMAVNQGDAVASGQRDFVCLYKMKQENKIVDGNFPAETDPVYE